MKRMTCLPNIGAFLAHFCHKHQTGHPFFGAQSCFARKGMNMDDESFQDIVESEVGTLGISQNSMLGDAF